MKRIIQGLLIISLCHVPGRGPPPAPVFQELPQYLNNYASYQTIWGLIHLITHSPHIITSNWAPSPTGTRAPDRNIVMSARRDAGRMCVAPNILRELIGYS